MAFAFSQCQARCLCRSSIDLSTRFGIWTWTKCGGTALRGLIDYSPLIAAQSNGRQHSGQGNASRLRGRSRVANRHGRSCPPLRPWPWYPVRRPAVRTVPRRPFRGLGLGLALSRGFAEAMGATLIPRTSPAADSPWCCPRPSRPPLPVGGLSRRPPAGIDGDTDWAFRLDALTAALVACHPESGRASQGTKRKSDPVAVRLPPVGGARHQPHMSTKRPSRDIPEPSQPGMLGSPHHRPVVRCVGSVYLWRSATGVTAAS